MSLACFFTSFILKRVLVVWPSKKFMAWIVSRRVSGAKKKRSARITIPRTESNITCYFNVLNSLNMNYRSCEANIISVCPITVLVWRMQVNRR